MAVRSVTLSNVVMVPGTDVITLSNFGSFSRLVGVAVSGMGTLSSPNEILVAMSTGGSGPDSNNPVELDPEAGNLPEIEYITTWSVQPTIGDILARLVFNTDGGSAFWDAREIEGPMPFVGVSGFPAHISFRSVIGSGPVSLTIFVDSGSS